MGAPSDASDGVRVLYVMGWVHCGSTILGNILGGIDGFFAAGEVRHLWRDVAEEREACGCGAPLLACPFWRAVLDRAFGGAERVDFERLVALDNELLLNRRFPRLMHAQARRRGSIEEYVDVLTRLYAAIRSVAGCRVVVDTSKSPLYALLLQQVEGIDLRVVQLVRDPRGWMYSRIAREDREIGWVTGLLLFDFWHALAEVRWRRHEHYVRLRYEDFARRPLETVGGLARLAGAPDSKLPFLDERRAVLAGNHNVNGNRHRTITGQVEILPDVRWRRGLPLGLRALGATLAAPVLLRHGYLPRRGSEQAEEGSFVLAEHSR